jgi:hypothetical protein
LGVLALFFFFVLVVFPILSSSEEEELSVKRCFIVVVFLKFGVLVLQSYTLSDLGFFVDEGVNPGMYRRRSDNRPLLALAFLSFLARDKSLVEQIEEMPSSASDDAKESISLGFKDEASCVFWSTRLLPPQLLRSYSSSDENTSSAGSAIFPAG